MVEQVAADLDKMLSDQDAVVLFKYHWEHGNRKLLCRALAEANMSIDKGNMYGKEYSDTEKLRISVDNNDIETISTILKNLGDSIDESLYPTLTTRVAITVANSCSKESLDTLIFLLNKSEIVRNMAGRLLEIQARTNCLEGVYLLVHRVKPKSSDNLISSKDINTALTSAIRESLNSTEDYTRVIEFLLSHTTKVDAGKIFLNLDNKLDRNISKLFMEKIKG